MKPKRIAVVIVNWNGLSDTLKCLSSLKKIDLKGNALSVIVVDNGSSDGSVATIRKSHPWVSVIPTGANLGFTGGNNVGIRYALKKGEDFIWLLNNDTVVDRHVLSLADAFADQTVGAAGSKIYFAPGREFHHDRYSEKERGKVIWYAGGLVDWANMYASHRGVDEVDRGQFDKPGDTDFITGCSLMVRASLARRIGGLDDRYYLYLEDLDYCLRIRRAGYRTVYWPASVLWHVNAGSSGRPGNPMQNYYLTRNRLFIGLRYAPVRTRAALLREAGRLLLTGSPVTKRAISDGLLGKYGKQYEPQKTTD